MLNYTKSSYITFYVQLCHYIVIPTLHTIYILPKLRTTWITQFCVITYPSPSPSLQLIIYDLFYTTRIKGTVKW